MHLTPDATALKKHMHQSMNQSAFNSNMSIARGYNEAYAGLEKNSHKNTLHKKVKYA